MNFLAPLEEEKPDSLLTPIAPRSLPGVQPEESGFFDLPAIEDLATTTDFSRKQRIAERGANTETRNNERQFAAQGKLQDFRDYAKEEMEPDWNQDFTNPLFDALGIFIYPQAGAALELFRSGNALSAFKQAGSEFANALPFIDEEDVVAWGLPKPERHSYSDVLREAKIFDDEGYGRWGSAVGGLMLDILLDPTTYTGYGTVANMAKGLQRYKAILRPLRWLNKAVRPYADMRKWTRWLLLSLVSSVY